METSQKAQPIWGDKLYQQRAQMALPILVRQAKAHKPIYYSQLAQELGMPNPRNLNYVLGSIGETLQQISADWGIDIPSINSLVINQMTHLPGSGVYWVANGIPNYEELSTSEKRDIIDIEFQKIYAFPRWLKLLDELGLPHPQNPDYSHHLEAIRRGNYGGGEGEAHRKFKEYVSRNPQLLGLPRRIGVGKVEFFLPSCDVADVIFKNGNEWVVAEVKSHTSDSHDIYRGLYQCVKYEFLVKAYQTEKGLSPNCRVVLVLEVKLPHELLDLRTMLGIEVIDEVQITP